MNDNGEHFEAASLDLHSVPCGVDLPFVCTVSVSLSHLSVSLCLRDETAQGLRTSHGTLEATVWSTEREERCAHQPCVRAGV